MGGVGGRCTHFMHSRGLNHIVIRPSNPYNAGTEHVRFSPARKESPAPSAKRRKVFGESHKELSCVLPRTTCEAGFPTFIQKNKCVLWCTHELYGI